MKWHKILIALGLLAGAGFITAQGLMDREPAAVEVQLATAKRATLTRTISGAGKLQPATAVKISSNLSGELTELLVREGDKVKAGQALGRIDAQLFEAAARQALAGASAARAELQLAKIAVDRAGRELERGQTLLAKGVASQPDFDRLSLDRESALARLASATQRHAQSRAQWDEAQKSLTQTTLISPMDGTVIELSREVGERVRSSDFSEDVVMVIAALDSMEMELEVSEQEVVFLEPGQKAEIVVDAFEEQTFGGTVFEIAQQATVKNPGTEAEVTSFPITVALTERPPQALPGMSAEARIAAQTREDTVVVPIAAVTVRAERLLPDFQPEVEESTRGPRRKGDTLARVVFVVDAQGKARARRVRTGISSETEMEILEGLEVGDRVVEGPYRTLARELKDGDRVKEQETKDRREG